MQQDNSRRSKMWWFVAVACLIHTTVSSEELTRSEKDGNPEIHMNVSQVISFRGYPSEEYEVLTDDDYYLTINRIPYGRKNLTFGGPKPVVLLQHGILAEASHWVENMADNSFGFILADAGYDVWLANSRGCRWSQRHQNFSTDQEEFWDFSFHEMAMYDLPATINFILQKTQQEKLYYIGYSQGASIGFIAFSAQPELSQKIKMFFALAPVVSIKHAPSPMLKLLLTLSENSVKGLFNTKDVVFWKKPVRNFIIRLCRNTLMKNIYARMMFSPGGFNATNLNMSRVDVYAAHFPDGSSVKNILHWQQVGKSELFRWFDYGSENQAKYNQSYPPLYEIEDMMVPTAVWSGGNDLVADPEDMKILLSQINKLVYHHEVSDWNHWDFIWGLNAPQRMYSKIIEFMRKSLF
ncbi:lysosomal acid lipase/cholesteryl ester hydrolase-like isoform X2 [Eublepharis macularius]|uniref:Lipase n=1 Tax=Eublepharis macularius TaxID=481883 RepID=A0AA97JJQ0_EUBMA|nr:lysosomal acid lipase/cholesteryl ester hydrolase-like isoform X2 [Eublepharis macularius]